MPQNRTYKNWKIVTEADFVSLFIKTWFAYISTLRMMFPEAYNRRGDKKFLNAYKNFYKRDGYKKLTVDENLMGAIEKLYREGRKVIMEQYPEYYLWDFYRINEDFEYTFRDIPPDKSNCLICGLKLYRRRGAEHRFMLTGFVKAFGEYYKQKYDENIQIQVDFSDVLKEAETWVRDNPTISEQDFMSWILDQIRDVWQSALMEKLKVLFALMETKYGKRMLTRANEFGKQALAVYWEVFLLNRKDETSKSLVEMERSRNTYELIKQRPRNYFLYHTDIVWEPQREMSPREKEWFKQLHEELNRDSVIWFLDFVYRLRNALFHEIIDPLDEEWQGIFKNAYLVLKEIVDLNIVSLDREEAVAISGIES